jgi:dihydrofolate reductase
MKLAAIVATDLNGVIGRNNQLPWKMKSDLQHFKQLTMNSAVILGRKTLQSIGRALPGREMLVLTRDKSFHCDYAQVFYSVESLISYCESLQKSIFIIGGAEIYQQLLPQTHCIYHTEIQARVEEGDAFFEIPTNEFKITESKVFDKQTGDDYAWKLHRWERV